MEATSSVPDPMIGLRSLLATIRRKRRVWLIGGLVGLIIGASLHLVVPHKYTAITDLYLAVPAGADPSQSMTDNVSLLQTETVAQQAVTASHIPMSAHALLSHYTGLPVSGNIMSIKFSGSSPIEAVSGARAVANAFLVIQARELSLQTGALVRGLKSQISPLNTQIDNLDSQISSLSGATPDTQSSDQLTGLVNQRSEDETQLSQLQGQINQALLNEQSVGNSSNVLDPAAVVPESAKKVVLVDALSGLVAGLAIGLAAVIFGALLSERPLDRSTVATTLGVPVELSLARDRNPLSLRRNGLSRLRKLSPDLRMIERRLRGHLESAPGSALAIVTVGTPQPAALAVSAMALALSSEGHRVVVVDAADNRPLASILGLNPKAEAIQMSELRLTEGPPLRVLVAPKDPLQMAQKPPPDDADALLILASLDVTFGAEHLASWVADAVMVLSSPGISLTRLEVSRQMLHEAGISLRSVILLGSDPLDDTSGSLSPVDVRYAQTAMEQSELSE